LHKERIRHEKDRSRQDAPTTIQLYLQSTDAQPKIGDLKFTYLSMGIFKRKMKCKENQCIANLKMTLKRTTGGR